MKWDGNSDKEDREHTGCLRSANSSTRKEIMQEKVKVVVVAG
jgi:hypothetical protein